MNPTSASPLPAPCQAARQRFSLALDERLSATDQDTLRGHLERCAPCRQEWRRWTAVSNAAQALPRTRAPAHLGERIRREWQAPPTRAAGLARAWKWAGAAAAAALLCTLSFLAGMRQAQGPDHTPDARVAEPALDERPEQGTEQRPAEGEGDQQPDGARPLRLVADRPFEQAEGGGDPERFARSTLAFLGDVVELPAIEPELRGPLLNAQLVHFNLPRQAQVWRTLPVTRPTEAGRTLDEAARWIQEVARALEMDPSGATLGDLRQQVLERQLVPRLREQLPRQQHRSLAGVDHVQFLPLVREAAPDLAAASQDSLARLLSLKDAWVSDRPSGHGDLDALEFLRTPAEGEMDGAVEAMVRQLLSLGGSEDTRTIVEEESGEHGGVQWQIRRVYTESHVFRTPDQR